MSRGSAVNEERPSPPPTDPVVALFAARRAHKKSSNRFASEETPLSNEPMFRPSQRARFEQAVLPHLDSAYNLARWLTGNEHDAEDVVQDAYLRAAKFFESFRGGDARPWLMTIVRRACYDLLERNRSHQSLTVFDEGIHSDQGDELDPAQIAVREESRELFRQALGELPIEFREIVVLRELEGLSYKEIAAITDLPPGTIMSRLARARERLRRCLVKNLLEGA
jgi:RNA polymerase sigma-70 factor (ECF subfamily)